MKFFQSLSFPLKVFTIFAVLCFSALLAHAADLVTTPEGVYVQSEAQVPVNPGLVQSTISGATSAFTNVVAIANKAIDSISGNAQLKAYGKRLTIMLASIVIIWSIIKNIALKQSLPQLIADMVFPMIITAFVLSAGLDVLPGVIKSTATSVAGIFGAGSGGGMENSLASSMFTAMDEVWSAKTKDGALSFLSSPIDSVAMLLLRIGIIILMLMATAIGVAAILVAKFQIALAIGLAGLFIPWILFKPTEFLFSGWLNFFLKAGFSLVGIFAVATVVLAGAKGMASLITGANADISDVLTFVAMGAMSVVFAYLMLKGGDIGEGLIGGSATGIGQLSAVAKGGAAMAAPRMAAATAGAAGSATKLGAARAAGRMVGPNDMGRGAQAMTDAAFRRGSFTRAAFEAGRGNKPIKPGD